MSPYFSWRTSFDQLMWSLRCCFLACFSFLLCCYSWNNSSTLHKEIVTNTAWYSGANTAYFPTCKDDFGKDIAPNVSLLLLVQLLCTDTVIQWLNTQYTDSLDFHNNFWEKKKKKGLGHPASSRKVIMLNCISKALFVFSIFGTKVK